MSEGNVLLRPGDPWTEHYRGTHYHFNDKREFWWRVPTTEARVMATAGHEDLLHDLLRLRPDGGSCRITETAAVITKDDESGRDWAPLYVCEYIEPLYFEEVDIHGNGLEPFDLWPAFYDGAKYSYKRNDLWWKNVAEGVSQRTREDLSTEILQRLLARKPFGGTLRFTENGKVLTLIEPQPLPRHLREQFEALTNTQKRLIQVKVEGTDMLPIFLGEYFGGFNLQPPEPLTDPLSDEQQTAMISFLKKYGDSDFDSEEELLYPVDDRPEEDI